MGSPPPTTTAVLLIVRFLLLRSKALLLVRVNIWTRDRVPNRFQTQNLMRRPIRILIRIRSLIRNSPGSTGREDPGLVAIAVPPDGRP